MSAKKKKGSLSDKIADILSTAPGQLDPEDDIYEETTARVTTNESEDENIDNTLSKFRTQNAALLEDVDQRYVGKKSSRKSFKESDDDWETEDEGLSTDEGEALDGIPGTQELVSEESDNEEESTGDEESANENESSDDNFDEEGDMFENEDDNFKHISESNVTNQMKKGNALRNQLNVWENLLEIRIQLQKCLLIANKFPQHETYTELKKDSNFKSAASTTEKNISNMLDKFLLLQSLLMKQYGETKNLMKAETKTSQEIADSDEEIPSDTEDEENSAEDEELDEKPVRKRRKLSDFNTEINQREQKYKSYRNSTIQKWNDKTRLGVGKSTAGTNTVLQQIDYLLGDKQRLIRKSQLKKSDFEILGEKQQEIPVDENESTKIDEYDTEIYDDTDFYHQLLRELIEVKSGDVTDPIQMSRQWIAIQNLRSKMKRKIDTKATKGRKIRYVVHSKLVNFMAPITDNSWNNEAKNELFSSLFGKNQNVK